MHSAALIHSSPPWRIILAFHPTTIFPFSTISLLTSPIPDWWSLSNTACFPLHVPFCEIFHLPPIFSRSLEIWGMAYLHTAFWLFCGAFNLKWKINNIDLLVSHLISQAIESKFFYDWSLQKYRGSTWSRKLL